VDTVITASEQSRKDILHFLPVSPDRLHVLPYAVAEGFRPIPKDDVRRMLVKKYDLQDPFLLCIGAANPRKNFNRLVDVFSRLSEDFPQLRLVVVGAQPKKPFTKDTASGPERSTRILHLGFVSDADLVLLYNGCAVFVYPSLYEGFGLPPLEAMACGAPVVCSDGSSLPEVAGDAALLVDPTDTRAVTEAVRNVLTHPDVACTMRRNGMQQARKFSWKQNASRTMELYRRLIDGKGA
jgi:glycosyltransferase involved in cell wall biosynthesis